jgi:gluconate 5-dehydrogenase
VGEAQDHGQGHLAHVRAQAQAESLPADASFYERLVGGIALRRIASTDDLVGAILFFLSDASAFVT